MRKITNVDKVWKVAEQEITKEFESFSPSEKEIEAKRKERLEHRKRNLGRVISH
jgi:hypothetical protein